MEAQHVWKIEWSHHFVDASVCRMSYERIPCFWDPHESCFLHMILCCSSGTSSDVGAQAHRIWLSSASAATYVHMTHNMSPCMGTLHDTYFSLSMYVCMYGWMDGCMYGWMYVRAHVCMYIYICMYLCMYVCMYVNMYVDYSVLLFQYCKQSTSSFFWVVTPWWGPIKVDRFPQKKWDVQKWEGTQQVEFLGISNLGSGIEPQPANYACIDVSMTWMYECKFECLHVCAFIFLILSMNLSMYHVCIHVSFYISIYRSMDRSI